MNGHRKKKQSSYKQEKVDGKKRDPLGGGRRGHLAQCDANCRLLSSPKVTTQKERGNETLEDTEEVLVARAIALKLHLLQKTLLLCCP